MSAFSVFFSSPSHSESADDVYPYATFELKDRTRKDSHYHSSPSSALQQSSNAFYICTQVSLPLPSSFELSTDISQIIQQKTVSTKKG